MRRTQGFCWLALGMGLLVSIIVSGCSSDDDDPDTEAATLDNLNTVLFVSEDGNTKLLQEEEGTTPDPETVTVVVVCPEAGEATISGTFTETETETARSFTLNAVVTFNACDGLDGSLTLDSTGTADQSALAFTATLDGAVENGCALSIQQLTQDVAVDIEARTGMTTISGSLTATCGAVPITCTWQDVSPRDRQELMAGCN